MKNDRPIRGDAGRRAVGGWENAVPPFINPAFRSKHLAALLTGARQVLRLKNFEDAAWSIFDICKEAVGAESGFVELLSENGSESELLFIDLRGRLINMDSAAPARLRGLRGEVYRTGDAKYENAFMRSEWRGFLPESHTPVENILLAPLSLDGKPLGVMGLANKPGGFTDDDKIVAMAFGEFIAIALNNSRSLDAAVAETNKFKAIVGALSDGMTIMNADYTVAYQNDMVKKYFGDRTGEKCYKAFERKDEVCEGCPVELAYQDGLPHTSLRKVVMPGGETAYWENTASPIRDADGKITACLEIAKNVTEKEKAEKENLALIRSLMQKQKMEALGQLAAGLANDFNNKLAVMMGCAQLVIEDLELEDYPETDGYRELQTLMDTALKARDLTQNLLTFARDDEPFRAKPAPVETLIEEAVSMLKRGLTRNVRIHTRFKDRAAMLKVDGAQIQQAILNICNNAVDAMPDGGSLTIETDTVDFDEDYCLRHAWLMPGRFCAIKIADTGCGIPEIIRDRIFDPFFTTKPLGKGTGIGLSVTHGIVRNHGGHIDFTSEPGAGTAMNIYLPMGGWETIAAPEAAPKLVAKEGETLLIVDDEPHIIKLMERILRRRGFNVISASSGARAVEIYSARSEEIHGVVLDFMMPEMNGVETLEAMMKINPGVKALIASGYAQNEDACDMIAAGAKAFLQKPFDINEICKTLRDMLDG